MARVAWVASAEALDSQEPWGRAMRLRIIYTLYTADVQVSDAVAWAPADLHMSPSPDAAAIASDMRASSCAAASTAASHVAQRSEKRCSSTCSRDEHLAL